MSDTSDSRRRKEKEEEEKRKKDEQRKVLPAAPAGKRESFDLVLVHRVAVSHIPASCDH